MIFRQAGGIADNVKGSMSEGSRQQPALSRYTTTAKSGGK